MSADTLAAHMMMRDYLGDVRSVIAEDGRVEEWTDCYPYGMYEEIEPVISGDASS